MARSWYDKFADAGRGLRVAVTGHNSFIVHLVCAVGVCGLAVWLNLQLWRWVAIIGCIVMVLVLELINTSIEHLARAVTAERHPEIGRSLDIAAAAVLVAAIGAVVIGLLVLFG